MLWIELTEKTTIKLSFSLSLHSSSFVQLLLFVDNEVGHLHSRPKTTTKNINPVSFKLKNQINLIEHKNSVLHHKFLSKKQHLTTNLKIKNPTFPLQLF